MEPDDDDNMEQWQHELSEYEQWEQEQQGKDDDDDN